MGGLGVEERSLGLDQLRSADEVFLTSSVMGVVPVSAVEDSEFEPGEWTERIDGRVESIGREMTHFDRKLTQGSESVQQAFRSMVGTVDRLEEKLWYLAHYPWTFVRPPRGPDAQALEREWRRALIARHYRELHGELMQAQQEFKPNDRSDQVRLDRIRQALRDLDAVLVKQAPK